MGEMLDQLQFPRFPFCPLWRSLGDLVFHWVFTEDASLVHPIEIAPDQQLIHFRVVRVFHGDGLSVEAVFRGECAHFLCVVVGHQEITLQFLTK